MFVLRIEHPVLDFPAWKAAFDSDPAHREQAGVRRYRILRGTDTPNVVMVDLEFEMAREAEAMLGALRDMWSRVDGSLISSPHARLVEAIETREYAPRSGVRP